MVALSPAVYGIFVAVFLVIALWLIIKRPWKKLTGETDSDSLKEDRKLMGIDKEVEKDEKDENAQARKLKDLMLRIYERGAKLKVPGIEKKQEYLNWIEKNLDVLAKENVEVDREKHLFGQINTAINLFLAGMPQNDKKTAKWTAEIRKTQNMLEWDIVEEAKLLRQKEAILRQEFSNTQKGLAA
jgi:hypothetical protein